MIMEVCCLVDKSIFCLRDMNYHLSYHIHDSVSTLRILIYYFCFFFSVDIYFEISDDANILEDRGAHSPVVRIL
jgi:hypothetical protein